MKSYAQICWAAFTTPNDLAIRPSYDSDRFGATAIDAQKQILLLANRPILGSCLTT
jgi:hypothetical protein